MAVCSPVSSVYMDFFGAASVVSFFYFSSILTHRWANINQKIFIKKIFFTSLTLRIIYVIFIYFFYLAKTGTPFEFNAGDALGYHKEALYILWLFNRGDLWYYFKGYLQVFSDAGWPTFMAFVYLLTLNSILIVRIVNALVSALMIVLIYRISQRNFGEAAARITAVMCMLLPAFIYYSGLHLKETFMIFLLMSFIERADYLLHSRSFTIIHILQVVLLGVSLFFFRTVLASAAWFALISAFLFFSDKMMSQYRRIIIIVWFVIASVFIFSGTILKEVSGYLGNRTTNQEQKYEHFSTREELTS